MGFKAQKKAYFLQFFLNIFNELLDSNFWHINKQHFKKISLHFHQKVLKIEPLRAGFRKPFRKKYPYGGHDNSC